MGVVQVGRGAKPVTDVDDDEPELIDNDPVPTDEEKH